MHRGTPPLPKGMELPMVRATHESRFVTLADGNYAGAIRHALDVLPVEVRVDRLVVLERAGQPPQVRLSLTILGEKGGDGDERNGSEILGAGEGLRASRG